MLSKLVGATVQSCAHVNNLHYLTKQHFMARNV